MKKIDINLLNSIGKPRAIIDGMLDRQIQSLEAKLGKKAGGAGNKLLSLFVQNGFRVQLTEPEVVKKMQETSSLSKNQIDTLLEGMLETGLLRQTPTEQFELSNNFIARKAHEKVEAENRVLRTIVSTIQDRMSRNELLDSTYLNYITPSLHQLDLNAEEKKFVKNSEAAVRKRRRLINLALTALIILLSFSTITAYTNSQRAISNLKQSKALNDQLTAEKAKTEAAQRQEKMWRLEADSARQEAVQEKLAALAARDTADQLRLKAIADRDSINALRQAAERLVTQLRTLRAQAEAKADEEKDLRTLADRNRLEADSLKAEALQVNKIITSRIAATRSLQIEDTHMRTLIALEAYRINKNNNAVGDIYHPNIVKALTGAAEARQENLFNSKEIVGSIRDIAVTPSGRTFYTTGSDGKVRAWDIKKWNELGKPEYNVREFEIQGTGVFNTIALSPDGMRLLIAGETGNFQILSASSGKLLSSYSLSQKGDKIYISEFDEDGNFCGLGKTQAYYRFEGFLGDIAQQQFRYKRNNEDRSPLISLQKMPSKVGLIRKVGKEFIAYSVKGYYDDFSYMINTQKLDGDKNEIAEFKLASGNENEINYGDLTALAFKQYDSTNGIMAYGFSSGRIILVRVTEEDEINEDPFFGSRKNIFTAHQAPVSTMEFSKNGRFLAVASYDGSVSLWDMTKYNDASYQPIIFDEMSSWAMTVAFANNDETLITGCKDGNLYFWNTNPDDYANYLCSHLDKTRETFIAQQKELDTRQKTGIMGIRHNELSKKNYQVYFGDMQDPSKRKVNVCER